MKSIIFAIVSLLVSVSYAELSSALPLEGQPVAPLGDLVAGDVVKVERLCPLGVTCVTDGTILTLEFSMPSGCFSMGEVNYEINADGDVEVSAYRLFGNGQVPADMDLICPSVMVYERSQLSLNMIFPPFKVIFKGTDVVIDVKAYSPSK
jgi:hypothetical protein